MIIEHKISIKATPDLVWTIITDFDNWPSWNPIVTSVNLKEGTPFGPGCKVCIKQPLQPMSEWIITKYNDKNQFEWETQRTGLRMRAIHNLVKSGHETISMLQLEVSGLLSWLLFPVLKHVLRYALVQENSGLKEHCELFYPNI